MKMNINDISVFAIGKLLETLDKVGHFPTHILYRDKMSLSEIYSDETCLHIERNTIPCLIARSLCRALINLQSNRSGCVIPREIISQIRHIIDQQVVYIQKTQRTSGYWNYVGEANDQSLPDDLDDTALALEILALYYRHILIDPDKIKGLKVKLIRLTLRQARRVREAGQGTEFAYKTWITEREDWSNIDPIVNGHVSSAALAFDMPELVPEDYLDTQFVHATSSTAANICASEYVSDFYSSPGIFWYALTPYCIYNLMRVDSLSPVFESQSSLLPKIFQAIFLFGTKSACDRKAKEKLLRDILQEAIDLKSIEPLYIENSRPQLTLYAFSSELYFALLLELISLQIKDE